MTLLAPVFLSLATLALVVIALHVRKRRRFTVPSLALWHRLQERRIKPRRALQWPVPSLLLFLQIGAVLAAAMALAGPLVGAHKPEHWIVVVDASAAMQVRDEDSGSRRFDVAVERVLAMAAEAGPYAISRMSLVIAGIEPELVLGRQPFDLAALDAALDRAEPSDGRANWQGAARFVDAVSWKGEAARIILVSARSIPDAFTTDQFAEIPVTRVVSGRPSANTGLAVGITPLDRQNGVWSIDGQVHFSGGAQATTVKVQFQTENSASPVDWAVLEVSAPIGTAGTDNAVVTSTFTREVTLPKTAGTLVVRGDADAAPFDDAVRFQISPELPTLNVLYVGNPDQALLRALNAVGRTTIHTALDVPEDVGRFGLVIVDDVEVSRTPSTNTLWIGRARVRGAEPAVLAVADAANWRNDHVLAEEIVWSQITVRSAYKVPTWPDGQVLLETHGGPLVQARTSSNGREVRIAFDLEGSDWTEQASFPAFIARFLGWSGVSPHEDQSCRVGYPCAVDAHLIGADVALGESVATLNREEVERIRSQLRYGYDGQFVPFHSGIYQFSRGGKTQSLIVNPAPLDPLSETTAEIPYETTEPPQAPLSLSRAFAVILLGLLVVETIVAKGGLRQFFTRAGRSASRAVSGLSLLSSWRVFALIAAIAALANVPFPVRTAHENVVLATVPGADGENDAQPSLLVRAMREADAAEGLQRIGAVPIGPAIVQMRDLTGATETETSDGVLTAEEALQLAAGMLPSDVPGRIILADDGSRTVSAFASVIPVLERRGIAVDYVPRLAVQNNEALVTAVEATSPLYEGDTFPLTGIIHTDVPQPAEIQVFRDGEAMATHTADLEAGYNRIETTISDVPEGEALYEIAVTAANDTLEGNNRAGIALRAASSGTIAVIASQRGQGAVLADALTSQGMTARVMTADRAPFYLDDVLDYNAIVLLNVPAIELTTVQQQLLKRAVFEHGRGLIIVGGDRSFGPGGYLKTTLEELSPLSSDVPREMPEVALVFVLDRSGSMQQAVGDVSRLDVARRATAMAIDQLNPQSQVSIIVFDDSAHNIMPLQVIPGADAIMNVLRPVNPGGGTAIYPGLELAYQQLRAAEAAAKHVIVMTDGLSQPADFDTLVSRMRADGITVSGVAIGRGASPRMIEGIAELGGGAFHVTADFEALPSILSQEALLLSGAPIVEAVAQPRWADRDSPFLASLPEIMPPVSGFVITSAKPEATLAMTVPDEKGEMMPLLAHWRFGNGHVMALATDATGAWTRAWQDLRSYPAFWSHAIRQFLPGNSSPGLSLRTRQQGDEIVVDLEALDADGKPATDLALTAKVSGPTTPELQMDEVRPGHYRGRFAAREGKYNVAVDSEEGSETLVVHVGYPARLDVAWIDSGTVFVAAATGGRRIDPDQSLFVGATPRWELLPGWRIWLGLALALFMIELLLRYGPSLVPGLQWGRRDSNERAPDRRKEGRERYDRAA